MTDIQKDKIRVLKELGFYKGGIAYDQTQDCIVCIDSDPTYTWPSQVFAEVKIRGANELARDRINAETVRIVPTLQTFETLKDKIDNEPKGYLDVEEVVLLQRFLAAHAAYVKEMNGGYGEPR